MTTTYGLYLESGPRHRKTMVHILDLLGCVAVGPTTEDALAAAPAAMRAYIGFLHQLGEPFDPQAPFDTRVVEHITEGAWLGNGSPYVLYAPDFEPVGGDELDIYLARYQAMRARLAGWARGQTDIQLDAEPPAGGRTGRAILLHVLGATGGYLAAALGGAPGFSKIYGAVERGELPIIDGLLQSADLAQSTARRTTLGQRAAVRQLPKGPRTFHQALRRMLEHDWEHLAELSRRPGGPRL